MILEKREREILPEFAFVQEGLKCHHYGLSLKNPIIYNMSKEKEFG